MVLVVLVVAVGADVVVVVASVAVVVSTVVVVVSVGATVVLVAASVVVVDAVVLVVSVVAVVVVVVGFVVVTVVVVGAAVLPVAPNGNENPLRTNPESDFLIDHPSFAARFGLPFPSTNIAVELERARQTSAMASSKRENERWLAIFGAMLINASSEGGSPGLYAPGAVSSFEPWGVFPLSARS